MSIGITRVSVIQRARRGDGDEFARLYAPLAFAMARKFGLSEPDAGDVSQQVILELLQLLPTFEYDRSKGSFKGLVKKIVRKAGRARRSTESIIAASGSVISRFSGTTRNANRSVTLTAVWNCSAFEVAPEERSSISR